MIPINKILFATDFSPYSNQAYLHAIALAENHGATLMIAHVYTPSSSMPLGTAAGIPIPPSTTQIDQDREYWREQLQQIRPLNPNIAVRHVLLIGEPAEEILGYAEDARADLIVMGTHGRTGLERLLMGSVAEKVLHKSPCSVMIVKMPKPLPVPQETEAVEALTPT